MSILRRLLVIAALASLFVTGPNLVPVQPYAAAVGDNGGYKMTKDYKDSIHTDIGSKSKKTNQQLSQEDLCYRDEGCEQANGGQQIEGSDNSADGFNDQSANVQAGKPGAVTPPVTPPPETTSTLIVNKNVECNFTSTTVPCPAADIFNITATTGNGSSLSFNGSESGTILTITPPFPCRTR